MQLGSGMLESSNVNTADAMVNMIELARHFEMQVKAIRTAEENGAAAGAAHASRLIRSNYMNPALWAAKTGLDAQQTRLAVTSNNLANVSTSGFKKGRAVFEDLLYQNVRQVGGSTSQDTQAPSGVHLGTGVRVVATEKIYTQGGLTQTGNALDVAIEGRGFFQIQMPDGTTAYTRDGSFQLSAQGQMVTSSGYVLQPGISIPDGSQSITIGRDGVVSVRVAGQAEPGAGRVSCSSPTS